jgi:hypothetical protein
MLTDASNRDYRLVSSARKLDSYVGQEVKITATAINPDDPSSGERGVNSGKPPNQPPALDVEDIEKLADHCSSPK